MTARVVAIIPARYGSQRLPGKPLADICGKPMIQHVYERAVQARLVDWCLVATDDERIASAVRAFGGHAVMTPEGLPTGTDRVAYVARSLPDADVIVNVQGDEPLLAPEMIDEAVRPIAASPDVTAGTLVRTIERAEDLTDPGVVKVVIDLHGSCLYFSRSPIPFARDLQESQWLSGHSYLKHIGLYVFRRDFLLRIADTEPTPLEMTEKLEQLRILENGHRILAVLTKHDSVPVDTLEDLEKVKALVSVGI